MSIYICGPISADLRHPGEGRLMTVYEKMERFGKAKTFLHDQGHKSVINPVTVGNHRCIRDELSDGVFGPRCLLVPGAVANGQGEHSWECYMKHDLLALLSCDTIALLPGWDRSRGASLEEHVAASLGFNRVLLWIDSNDKIGMTS